MDTLHCMATITSYDDIFTIHAPDKKSGDIIEILDTSNVARRAKLSVPMGDDFAFEWVAETAEAHFTKPGDEWLIQTTAPHVQGDRVTVNSKNGEQQHVLGEAVGENLFRPQKRNHFLQNPTGSKPKWCVRVYEEPVKPGDIVEVLKKDNTTQRQQLVSQVAPGVWTTKKV